MVAPAGYGKSTLVADWAGQRRAPTAWITLDAGDSDGTRLVTALTQVAQDIGIGSGALPPGRDGVDELQSLLAKAPAGLVLVLDDVHELTPRALRQVLGPLVRFAPDTVRLILVSRYDPPALPVNKLRLHGQLGELRQDVLAFSVEEITALAQAMNQRMDRAAAEQLRTVTEGWAVAVSLALMSLRESADHSAGIRLMRDLDVPVNEYLVEQVLDQLPPALSDFVLRATISDRVTPGLADHLVSGGAHLLEECVAQGLFLTGPSPDRGELSYRWNPLFAAHCRGIAARREPRMPPALHRKAAQYLRNREGTDAFAHAVQAADASLALEIFADVWPDLLVLGATDLLLAMARALPPQRDGHPEVRLARAAANAMETGGDVAPGLPERWSSPDAPGRPLIARLMRLMATRAGPDVAELEPALASLLAEVNTARLPTRAVGLWVVGRARLSLDVDSPHAMDLLEDAIRCANGCGLWGAQIACRAEQGILLWRRGDLQGADEHAALAISQASVRGWERAAALSSAYLVRGLVAFWRDHLTDAEALLTHAVESAGQGFGEAGAHAALCLAIVQLARGEVSQSRHTQARDELFASPQAASPGCRDLRDVVRGMTLQAEGDLAGALAIARHDESERHAFGRLWEAALLRHCGDRAGARAALQRLPTLGRHTWVEVDARLLTALLHADDGEIGASHAVLEQALARAAGGLILRPFHSHASALRTLLIEHLDWGTSYADLIRRALATHGREPGPSSAATELTARETEVLACLRSAMSTAEIATSLFLSVNTVKTHQRAIYRKLGAEGRRAAVRRGLDLGLI